MARPELGTKRQCGGCPAKFYDLDRDPIVCPKCETVFELVVTPVRSVPAPAPAPVPKKVEAVEPAGEVTPDNVEAVSLEDAESGGEDIPDIEDVTLDDDEDELESRLIPDNPAEIGSSGCYLVAREETGHRWYSANSFLENLVEPGGIEPPTS